MILRRAKFKDLDQCLDIGEAFWETTPYSDVLDYSRSGVLDLLTGLIPAGLMLVAEFDGKIIGVAALLVTPFHFNPAVKIGTELFWYVDPDSRESGVGALMLDAIESMAKEKGATLWSMSSFGLPDADTMLKKRGYKLTERSYTKVL